jgi:hypothetical protein
MLPALQSALIAVFVFLPKLLLFIVILVVGLIVASLIAKGLTKLLRRVGFDRLVERGGVKKALEKSKLDAAAIISKILYWALVLFILQFAFGVFGPNPVTALLAAIIAFLPRVIVAIVIVIITAAIAAGAKGLIQNTLGGLSYGRILANAVSILILFFGIIAALNQVEIATTVTEPILITVLAIVAGVIIVGAGGGLIKPMQQRWETMLNRATEEAGNVRQQAASAPSIGEQAQQARAKAKPKSASGSQAPLGN